MAIDAALLAKSKAALEDYDARNRSSVGSGRWVGGGEPSAYAQAVLGVGDNADGSTDPGDYDARGALKHGGEMAGTMEPGTTSALSAKLGLTPHKSRPSRAGELKRRGGVGLSVPGSHAALRRRLFGTTTHRPTKTEPDDLGGK